jgi:hypothetical protein
MADLPLAETPPVLIKKIRSFAIPMDTMQIRE